MRRCSNSFAGSLRFASHVRLHEMAVEAGPHSRRSDQSRCKSGTQTFINDVTQGDFVTQEHKASVHERGGGSDFF